MHSALHRRFEINFGHNLVSQPNSRGFLARDGAASENKISGMFLADQSC